MTRVLIAVVLVLTCTSLVLVVAGWRPVVLLSDSMAPGAPAGSLLIARPVAPSDVAVGDVLTVPLPAGDSRVTHRVVALDVEAGRRWVRLQGDANETPDAGRVALDAAVLRTVAVVPGLGGAVDGGSVVLLAGIALLLVGTIGLAFVERRSGRRREDVASRSEPRLPTGSTGLDTRALALLATLEALADDGMEQATLEALGRARVGALLGLGAVEDSEQVAALDDGARFVVIAFADADPDALGLVPDASGRATAARAAVGDWWRTIEHRVPTAVRVELEDTLAAAGDDPIQATPDEEAGIGQGGPVD